MQLNFKQIDFLLFEAANLRHCLNWIENLRKQGIDVGVLNGFDYKDPTTFPSAMNEIGGIQIQPSVNKTLNSILRKELREHHWKVIPSAIRYYNERLNTYLDERDPEFCVLSDSFHYSQGLLAYKIVRQREIPFAVNYAPYYQLNYKTPLNIRNKASLHIVRTREMVKELEIAGIPNSRIVFLDAPKPIALSNSRKGHFLFVCQRGEREEQVIKDMEEIFRDHPHLQLKIRRHPSSLGTQHSKSIQEELEDGDTLMTASSSSLIETLGRNIHVILIEYGELLPAVRIGKEGFLSLRRISDKVSLRESIVALA